MLRLKPVRPRPRDRRSYPAEGMGLIRRAAEAAERTPDDRNRYADFLRVAAIGAVVLGHWLVIDIDVADGAPSGSSVLATLSWAQWATWAFQVIPAFFLVGGYANSASWRRHAAAGGCWGSWLRRRAIRHLWPTAGFIGAGVVMAVIAEPLGVPGGVLGEARKGLWVEGGRHRPAARVGRIRTGLAVAGGICG